MTGLREIWNQNSVDDPTDMSNTVAAVLKGDSLTAYEAAVEDLTVDPNDENLRIMITEEHVEEALRAVTNAVFPFRALETQKQWMSKYMKKPYDMPAKTMTTAMSRINNFLPYFPEATMNSKYTEKELIGILEFAVPPHWRKAFDLRDYIPTQENKAKFITECDRIERNETPKSNDRNEEVDDNKNSKKVKFAKSEKSAEKNGKRTSTDDGQFYCTLCGHQDTHKTERCWKLKKIARDKESGDKAHAKTPYSKRTFRKEVNAMARRAGKHGDIKIVEKAIKREQIKSVKANKPNKKKAKAAAAKKAESSDSESSSDGSMHNMEARIPRKKRVVKKRKNVRFNSQGKVVAIEDSDSEDERKMPAQISRKKPKLVADPMDTDSDETDEDEDCFVSKEEKAFLKSIDKKEITINDSDSDSD
jgi:hypothetical protein